MKERWLLPKINSRWLRNFFSVAPDSLSSVAPDVLHELPPCLRGAEVARVETQHNSRDKLLAILDNIFIFCALIALAVLVNIS